MERAATQEQGKNLSGGNSDLSTVRRFRCDSVKIALSQKMPAQGFEP
jgi:hypothetical protein